MHPSESHSCASGDVHIYHFLRIDEADLHVGYNRDCEEKNGKRLIWLKGVWMGLIITRWICEEDGMKRASCSDTSYPSFPQIHFSLPFIAWQSNSPYAVLSYPSFAGTACFFTLALFEGMRFIPYAPYSRCMRCFHYQSVERVILLLLFQCQYTPPRFVSCIKNRFKTSLPVMNPIPLFCFQIWVSTSSKTWFLP